MLRQYAVASLISLVAPLASVFAADQILLTPQIMPGAVDRVEVNIEVGGKLEAKRFDSSARDSNESETTTSPLRVVGKVAYKQRLLPGSDAVPMRSVRWYERADVAITTGADRSRPELRDNRRLVVCDHADSGVRVWSPQGPLATAEADLLDIAGNTLFCDQLLPVEAVEVGDTWEHSAGDLAALLGLEAVTSCQGQSKLTQANDRFAKVELSADVEGAVDGTTTAMMVEAIYLIDAQRGRVTQFNLAIKETRKMGPVTPGLEAVAKLQVSIEPISAANELSDEVVDTIPESPFSDLLEVTTVANKLGLRVTHDRRWYLTAESADSATLRQIDDAGLLLAHCTMSRPKSGQLKQATALKTFRAEVRSALGEQFGQFTADRQWITPAGYRAVAVTSVGQVDGVPVEWRSYLLGDDQGRRIALNFTLDESSAERFGKADGEIVDTIRFVESNVASRRSSSRR